MGDARHLHFDWNRHLLFHFLAGPAWPLRDDLHIVIRNVRVGFDRKILERDSAPTNQYGRQHQDQELIAERIIDKCANPPIAGSPIAMLMRRAPPAVRARRPTRSPAYRRQ